MAIIMRKCVLSGIACNRIALLNATHVAVCGMCVQQVHCHTSLKRIPVHMFCSSSCRVSRLLMPVCFLAGMLNYLDRTNLNFAALQLNAELGFTPSVSLRPGNTSGTSRRQQRRSSHYTWARRRTLRSTSVLIMPLISVVSASAA